MTFRIKTNRGGYLEYLLKQERFPTREAALARIAEARRGVTIKGEPLQLEEHGAPLYVVEYPEP